MEYPTLRPLPTDIVHILKDINLNVISAEVDTIGAMGGAAARGRGVSNGQAELHLAAWLSVQLGWGGTFI